MNKYIRTEDGIHEIFDTHNGCSNHFGYKYNEYCTVLLDEEDIKKYRQSDTIEELCDEFVLIKNDGKPHILRDYDNLSFVKERTLYGAVWTEEGLIYAIKMKGILSNGEIDWKLL